MAAAIAAIRELLSQDVELSPRELRNELQKRLAGKSISRDMISAVIWKLVDNDELQETSDYRVRLTQSS